MKVVKCINNNVAICLDDDNNELVAFGKGIGFKKPPFEIDVAVIQKTYYGIDENYVHMINEIPEEILLLSEEIIKYAENELDYSEELELYASDENRSREVRDFLMKHHEKIDCILVESGVEPSLMTCFYEYGWNRVPVGVVGTSWNFIQPDNRLVTLFGAPEPVFQSAADILLDSFNKKDMQMWPDEMICIKTQILNHTEMERN